MSATVIIPLKPGRYVVRGGPRGDTVTQRVMADIDEYRSMDCGRIVVRSRARDAWPVLAVFKVRPGRRVTCYGVLDAVARVWTFGT